MPLYVAGCRGIVKDFSCQFAWTEICPVLAYATRCGFACGLAIDAFACVSL